MQIDDFIQTGVHMYLNAFNESECKPSEALRFLESVEQQIPESSDNIYVSQIKKIVDFTVRRENKVIEETLLTKKYSEKQNRIINEYIENNYPNIKVVKHFFENESVKAIGSAKNQISIQSGSLLSKVKEQGVNLFNGLGDNQ